MFTHDDWIYSTLIKSCQALIVTFRLSLICTTSPHHYFKFWNAYKIYSVKTAIFA